MWKAISSWIKISLLLSTFTVHLRMNFCPFQQDRSLASIVATVVFMKFIHRDWRNIPLSPDESQQKNLWHLPECEGFVSPDYVLQVVTCGLVRVFLNTVQKTHTKTVCFSHKNVLFYKIKLLSNAILFLLPLFYLYCILI